MDPKIPPEVGNPHDPDVDPLETREWIEALDALIASEGADRATFLLRRLLQHARTRRVPLPQVLATPYVNTVPLAEQPPYQGNLEIEARISALVRWNALAMVVRANRASGELGGHIASYASAADLFEVGFNHFFRAGERGDLVYFQPHSAPGIYARAFLEGRLTEEQLDNYRRETGGKGLSSYCHPWLMPTFWQFPTGSMGLGPLFAIYQARFMRYLGHRGFGDSAQAADRKARKVWCFVGDGEMDEPESLAGLSLAGREKLDNLVLVVNCNLQRLDGPVRGNGSVIQELEGLFAGAGWNVIKLLWSGDWDPLFARDTHQWLEKRFLETVDGEFQTYAATSGAFNREHFFNKYPELQQLVAHLSDDDIDRLRRGGHDPVKIFSAYWHAARHEGQPTVILAKTKKGYGMGTAAQGRMTGHQHKKLDTEELIAFRDRFALPLADAQCDACEFVRPPREAPEMAYLHARREKLDGYLPARSTRAESIATPDATAFAKFALEANGKEMSTTVAYVRMAGALLKDAAIGKRIVPIIADEARTFGMADLFRQVGIYSPIGQLYQPEDREQLSYYKEAVNGQILEEGINEAGALASWVAAATSYSTHGEPMLPMYIYYSMFGFQRVGDEIWAAADSRGRGFLLGATAGRTTLSGEGLQHQDGSSHLVASTIPNCRAYDPAFAYELAVIVEDGMRRMLTQQEDIFYYVTLMNESYAQPSMPPNCREGILKGMYELRKGKQVRLLGAGTILNEVVAAADLLEKDWKIDAEVRSVTSFTQLRWNAMESARRSESSWVSSQLPKTGVPVIAASDYVSAVADLIRPWIGDRYVALGTDGFGRSDTRANLRRFFEVDRHSIAVAALDALGDKRAGEARQRYGIEPGSAPPWAR
ncbi:MAG TPA: pyruvate dehydrogenase (acetyl-transferring), homodimeric type [Usitatibacter sp.]|nr:pyruvate dehydrogenase (acetyl-transferring), homodimeric type [Usitatibacter sp.]